MTHSVWISSVLTFALGVACYCPASGAALLESAGTSAGAVIAESPAAPGISPNPHHSNPTLASVAREAGGTGEPDKEGLPLLDQRLLAAHNKERLALGLQPLSWDPNLARDAQSWANHLAATGVFEHAPENPLDPEGENLWAGTKGFYPPEAQVEAWIREKRFFRPGLCPDNSVTGNFEDVGHYTQVVWRATTEVGCGEASGKKEDFLVCRYAEAGNYRGEKPF